MKLENGQLDPGDRPVRMYVFFTRGFNPVSNAIAWVTCPVTWLMAGKMGDVPSHTGIGFQFASGKDIFFEARDGAGWHGPHPIKQLQDEVMTKKCRWARKYYISTSEEMMMRKYHKCLEKRSQWVYGREEFVRMYAWSRLRWMHWFESFTHESPPTPNRVVCSEAVARILDPEIDLIKLVPVVGSVEHLSPMMTMLAVAQITLQLAEVK